MPPELWKQQALSVGAKGQVEHKSNSDPSSPTARSVGQPSRGEARCIPSLATRTSGPDQAWGKPQHPHSVPSDTREQGGALHGHQTEMT